MRTEQWRAYLHSSLLDEITPVLSTLQTLELWYGAVENTYIKIANIRPILSWRALIRMGNALSQLRLTLLEMAAGHRAHLYHTPVMHQLLPYWMERSTLPVRS